MRYLKIFSLLFCLFWSFNRGTHGTENINTYYNTMHNDQKLQLWIPLDIHLCIPHDANSSLSMICRYFCWINTKTSYILLPFFLVYYPNPCLYKFLLIHNYRKIWYTEGWYTVDLIHSLSYSSTLSFRWVCVNKK